MLPLKRYISRNLEVAYSSGLYVTAEFTAEQKHPEAHESRIFAEKAQHFLQATLFGDAADPPSMTDGRFPFWPDAVELRYGSIIASTTKKMTCENLCIPLVAQ